MRLKAPGGPTEDPTKGFKFGGWAMPYGLIVGHYEREGQVKIGGTTLDSPSEREIARRKRIKREG